MKFVATSDIHGDLPRIPVCDAVLICGDISPVLIQRDIKLMNDWMIAVFDYWVNKLDIDYSSKLEDLDVSIGKLKEVKEFTKTKGKFNIMSPDHLTIIFRDMLKLPQIKITEKGKFSVDNEVMASYKNKGIVLAHLS